MLKEIIKKLIPQRYHEGIVRIKNDILNGYAVRSYSQEGEDMILRRVFENQESGFYVDVGAHHPKRFSNTYFFYKNGWRGINIDAMPGSMKPFHKKRPRDINLEIPISSKKQQLTYYIFNEPALNSFSKEISEKRDTDNGTYKIVSTVDIETAALSEILGKYLSKNHSIDFLSVDVEGLDYDVLISNDWSRFRPKVVLVEVLGATLEELVNHEITKLLRTKGYTIFAKCVNTVFFRLGDI